MSYHSPGPWQFDGRSRIDSLPLRQPSGHAYLVTDQSGSQHEEEWQEGLVALVYAPLESGRDFETTLKANIALIEAAPDLLQAAKSAWHLLQSAVQSALPDPLHPHKLTLTESVSHVLGTAIAKAERNVEGGMNEVCKSA